MKLKALLYLDDEYIEVIRNILLKEDVEVYDLLEKDNFSEEIIKGYLDVVFFSCSCNYCTNDATPTINKIKQLDPRLEIICVGTRENEANAIEAIKLGATACIGTPIDQNQIIELLKKIREHSNRRKEILKIETALHEQYTFSGMVSKNPVMLNIFSLIKRIAPYYHTMLIEGDTGTGKEVLAKAIHDLSPSKNKPFVACNCSGLVENLIESELFGHEKGSFTGAISDKKGLFEAAGSGTIFLDEISDMPLSFQPHLLRVLQDGEFRRVGSTQPMKSRCRVIAASNVDLYKKAKAGEFREDLYFRLAVITTKIPALNDRKEDIPLLCRFFLDKLNKKIGKDILGITMDARRLIMSYDWPGNIRELENVIERALLVTTVNFLRPHDLPTYLDTGSKQTSPTSLLLDEVEKNHIQKVLITTGGHKTKTAALLGISRRALSRKITKYKIEE